jgi:streptogramin lyase
MSKRRVEWPALGAGLFLAWCVIGCGGGGGATNASPAGPAPPTARAALVEYRRIGDAGAGADSARTADDWRPVDPLHTARGGWSSSVWLGSLPNGEAKRRYILDCTGCHQLNETRVFAGDSLRARSRWSVDAMRMIGFAGSETGFPVISHDAHPDSLAAFLSAHLGATPPAGAAATYEAIVRPPADTAGAVRARLTEYQLPVAPDLPHDVAVTSDGSVLVTGMFTGRIYRVDPERGVTGVEDIPVDRANPRAIELDAAGNWWVLCGAPMKVARFEPGPSRWTSWDIGMYPHSIAPAMDGSRIWFNGHFTRDPEQIGWLDPATGQVTTADAPIHPELGPKPGGPIPYEARLAPNGTLWISELQGNRLLGYNPGNGVWRVAEMPTTWSGPRRFDVGPDGVLWIPAYAAGTLVRFDPASGNMEEIPLPIADSVPYVARVDPRTRKVWIGTAAADVVYRFDPATRRFDVLPIPTRGASMRHLAIDPVRGDVWVAYGASPAIHPARVARIEVVSD